MTDVGRATPQTFNECIEHGWLEVFRDGAGVERVRLTPKGMRLAGVDEEEIAEIVEEERKAGRPYKLEAAS